MDCAQYIRACFLIALARMHVVVAPPNYQVQETSAKILAEVGAKLHRERYRRTAGPTPTRGSIQAQFQRAAVELWQSVATSQRYPTGLV